eukprot:scaffold396_cov339-Prasinococcus_capsulatus_cf.AAC.20
MKTAVGARVDVAQTSVVRMRMPQSALGFMPMSRVWVLVARASCEWPALITTRSLARRRKATCERRLRLARLRRKRSPWSRVTTPSLCASSNVSAASALGWPPDLLDTPPSLSPNRTLSLTPTVLTDVCISGIGAVGDAYPQRPPHRADDDSLTDDAAKQPCGASARPVAASGHRSGGGTGPIAIVGRCRGHTIVCGTSNLRAALKKETAERKEG